MTTPRALLLAAIAASVLLAGCSSAAPSTPSGGAEPSSAASPTSDAPLDYPFYFDEAVQDAVAGVQLKVAAWHDDFAAVNCTAEEAIDENSECPQLLVTGLTLANELKNTVFGIDEADFETSSGMANFKPVWDAALASSESGSDWAGTCQYGPANDGCGDKASVLIADLTEYSGAFADWKP